MGIGKPILVQKYGGSSVADPDKIRRVAAQVARAAQAGYRVVVVVSAMGKTTDGLLSLAHQISAAPQRRELDMLLSTGERISMALLAMALHEQGIAAMSFTGSQSGIITNNRHSGARIIEVRPIRIQDALDQGHVVIVAGFQGMSQQREITTLGRGGSDTTAVALAAALDAQACEIYSDVDGVYTADPRQIPTAQHLPEISYDEMQVLAEQGAKVLNAQAVAWAKRAGITIVARKTGHNPGDRETRVVGIAHRHGCQVSAITATAVVHQLTWERNADVALGCLQEHAVFCRSFQWEPGPSGGRLAVSLVRDDLPDWSAMLDQLHSRGAPPHSNAATGTVTTVGTDIGNQIAAIAAGLDHLRKHNVPVLSSESRPLVWTVTVPTDQVPAAAACLHQLWIA